MDARSGVTVEPLDNVTRKSEGATVLGRTGQLNSTGSPSAFVVGDPYADATCWGVDAEVYADSFGVAPATQAIRFQVPPACRTSVSLSAGSSVVRPGTPM